MNCPNDAKVKDYKQKVFNLRTYGSVDAPSESSSPFAGISRYTPDAPNLESAPQHYEHLDPNMFAAWFASPNITLSGTSHEPGILLDSGSTCHMSGMRSAFKTFKEFPPSPIDGIGQGATATGSGSINLRLENGQHITVNNVLYIPSLQRTIISTSQLFKKGLTTHFGKSALIKNSNRVVASGHQKDNGLYYLNATILSPTSHWVCL